MKLVQESRGEHAGGGVMYVRGLCEGTAKLEGQASVSKAYAAFKICSPDRLPRNPPTGAKDSRPKHLDCRGKRNRQRRIIFVRAAYSVAVAGALFMALTIGRAQTVPIDGALVDLIDQTAPNFYNTGWGLSLEQFKAWLATIAWAEGGYGGYGAHSGGSLGSDYYYHVAVGAQFTFSTGLGPFQLDRGSSESWGLWPSIRKLNPHQSVESAARWHRDNFGAGATLGMFANNSVWVAVQAPADYWYAVTGTSWANHSGGRNFLNWTAIKAQLAANALVYPHLRYEQNVQDRGMMQWQIPLSAGLTTDSGRNIVFMGAYQTYLITARSWGGTAMHSYYLLLYGSNRPGPVPN